MYFLKMIVQKLLSCLWFFIGNVIISVICCCNSSEHSGFLVQWQVIMLSEFLTSINQFVIDVLIERAGWVGKVSGRSRLRNPSYTRQPAITELWTTLIYSITSKQNVSQFFFSNWIPKIASNASNMTAWREVWVVLKRLKMK